RLSRSMENWITNLYNSSEAADIQSVIAHQTRIGEVHARVSIPVHLVLRGARLLKQRLITYLREELPERQAAEAAAFAATLIDLTMEIRSHAYTTPPDRRSRAEESYRRFGAGAAVV